MWRLTDWRVSSLAYKQARIGKIYYCLAIVFGLSCLVHRDLHSFNGVYYQLSALSRSCVLEKCHKMSQNMDSVTRVGWKLLEEGEAVCLIAGWTQPHQMTKRYSNGCQLQSLGSPHLALQYHL